MGNKPSAAASDQPLAAEPQKPPKPPPKPPKPPPKPPKAVALPPSRALSLPFLRNAQGRPDQRVDRLALLYAQSAYDIGTSNADKHPDMIIPEDQKTGGKQGLAEHSATETRFVVAVDGPTSFANDTMFIAARGTVADPPSYENIVTDLDLLQTTVPGVSPDVKVHEGFLHAYRQVREVLVQEVLSCLDWAKQAHGTGRNINHIVVTGHSLGGALAVLAVLDIFLIHQRDVLPDLDENISVTLVTYGCPHVGNQAFADLFAGELSIRPHYDALRIFNFCDPVPHAIQWANVVPLLVSLEWIHIGEPIDLERPLQTASRVFDATVGVAAYMESLHIQGHQKTAGQWGELLTAAHSLTAYCANLDAKYANYWATVGKDGYAIGKQAHKVYEENRSTAQSIIMTGGKALAANVAPAASCGAGAVSKVVSSSTGVIAQAANVPLAAINLGVGIVGHAGTWYGLYKVNNGVVNNGKMLQEVLTKQKETNQLMAGIREDSSQILELLGDIHKWLDPLEKLKENLQNLREDHLSESDLRNIIANGIYLDLKNQFRECFRRCTWATDDAPQAMYLLSLAIETAHLLLALDMCAVPDVHEFRKIKSQNTMVDEAQIQRTYVDERVEKHMRSLMNDIEPVLGFFIFHFGETNPVDASRLCAAFTKHFELQLCQWPALKQESSDPKDGTIVVNTGVSNIHNEMVKGAVQLLLDQNEEQARDLYVRSLAYNPGRPPKIVQIIEAIDQGALRSPKHMDLSVGAVDHEAMLEVMIDILTTNHCNVIWPVQGFELTNGRVDLPGQDLQPIDALVISKLIVLVNMELTELDLRENDISAQGLKFIAVVLPKW
jgi:hypothetical protein